MSINKLIQYKLQISPDMSVKEYNYFNNTMLAQIRSAFSSIKTFLTVNGRLLVSSFNVVSILSTVFPLIPSAPASVKLHHIVVYIIAWIIKHLPFLNIFSWLQLPRVCLRIWAKTVFASTRMLLTIASTSMSCVFSISSSFCLYISSTTKSDIRINCDKFYTENWDWLNVKT